MIFQYQRIPDRTVFMKHVRPTRKANLMWEVILLF
jgi:hypothetical protein